VADNIEMLLRFHAQDEEFYVQDAICLWLEIDPEGKKGKFLEPLAKLL